MKYILLSLFFSLAVVLKAEDAPKKKSPPAPVQRPHLTEEQKKVRTQMLEKYDLNKDGKLDKSEFEKISDVDKKKIKEAGLGRPQPPRQLPPQKKPSK